MTTTAPWLNTSETDNNKSMTYEDLYYYISGDDNLLPYNEMPEFIDTGPITSWVATAEADPEIQKGLNTGCARVDFSTPDIVLPCVLYRLDNKKRNDYIEKYYPPEQVELDILWLKNEEKIIDLRAFMAMSENLITMVIASSDRCYFSSNRKADRPSYFRNNISPYDSYSTLFNPHRAATESFQNFLYSCHVTGLAVYMQSRNVDTTQMKRMLPSGKIKSRV